MGLTPPKQERSYNYNDITGKKPYPLFRKGIGYVPDDRRVFADLSVDDNLVSYTAGHPLEQGKGLRPLPALTEMKTETLKPDGGETTDAPMRGHHGKPGTSSS